MRLWMRLSYLSEKMINYPRGWPALGVITLPSVRKMGRLSVILQYDSPVFYQQATRCKDQTLMIKQYKLTKGATRLYIKCLGPRIYAANKLTNMLQTVMPEKILETLQIVEHGQIFRDRIYQH